MKLEAKTATHELISTAEQLVERFEMYQGCKGMFALDDAINNFMDAVCSLRSAHTEDFSGERE
jgi:hypothetical protein